MISFTALMTAPAGHFDPQSAYGGLSLTIRV
jgi:hypothetical protein